MIRQPNADVLRELKAILAKHYSAIFNAKSYDTNLYQIKSSEDHLIFFYEEGSPTQSHEIKCITNFGAFTYQFNSQQEYHVAFKAFLIMLDTLRATFYER